MSNESFSFVRNDYMLRIFEVFSYLLDISNEINVECFFYFIFDVSQKLFFIRIFCKFWTITWGTYLPLLNTVRLIFFPIYPQKNRNDRNIYLVRKYIFYLEMYFISYFILFYWGIIRSKICYIKRNFLDNSIILFS